MKLTDLIFSSDIHVQFCAKVLARSHLIGNIIDTIDKKPKLGVTRIMHFGKNAYHYTLRTISQDVYVNVYGSITIEDDNVAIVIKGKWKDESVMLKETIIHVSPLYEGGEATEFHFIFDTILQRYVSIKSVGAYARAVDESTLNALNSLIRFEPKYLCSLLMSKAYEGNEYKYNVFHEFFNMGDSMYVRLVETLVLDNSMNKARVEPNVIFYIDGNIYDTWSVLSMGDTYSRYRSGEISLEDFYEIIEWMYKEHTV